MTRRRQRYDLGPASRPLEPTYSVDEVAAYYGCTRWKVHELVRLGNKYGPNLHPSKGGFYPTFLSNAKGRRIPRGALERHQAHLELVASGRAHRHAEKMRESWKERRSA